MSLVAAQALLSECTSIFERDGIHGQCSFVSAVEVASNRSGVHVSASARTALFSLCQRRARRMDGDDDTVDVGTLFNEPKVKALLCDYLASHCFVIANGPLHQKLLVEQAGQRYRTELAMWRQAGVAALAAELEVLPHESMIDRAQ